MQSHCDSHMVASTNWVILLQRVKQPNPMKRLHTALTASQGDTTSLGDATQQGAEGDTVQHEGTCTQAVQRQLQKKIMHHELPAQKCEASECLSFYPIVCVSDPVTPRTKGHKSDSLVCACLEGYAANCC